MRLTGLFVYPIKACAGIALESSEVVSRGLSFDRRYMLVDRTGTFVSQRELPRLCLVDTRFADETLLVSAPGMSELAVPRAFTTGEKMGYSVWGSSGQALRHADGSRWFSEVLGDEVSLIYMPEDERRAVNPTRAQPGDIVSFADGYPLLLISEESLADLNARLAEPVEMRRFRPNLVIAGCQPYAEDRLGVLQIGELSFRAVKRCDRCSVTTVNAETGERGKEPLRTLSRYRLEDHKVWFGMNLIHDSGGRLLLGDAVTLPPIGTEP